MRFNSKELAQLSQGPASKFDREGILWMKDKQEGLFKKGEVYLERYFRLRGNLLFYFKSIEAVQTSDPIGVFILERCTVELDTNEDRLNSLLIVFEGDDKIQYFAAANEKERDAWIESLHIASYECLRMQVESIREQIRSRTGLDPITQTESYDRGADSVSRHGSVCEEAAVEICIACDGLPPSDVDVPPNPFAVVSTIMPPQQNWVQHSHTEIIDKCSDPQFLTTIGFGDNAGVDVMTRVKLVIYNVKEKMTATMCPIGQVVFTLNDMLCADNFRLRLSVVSQDYEDAGHITLMGWVNSSSADQGTTCNSHTDKSKMIGKGPSRKLDMLKAVNENIISKCFRFDTNDGEKLLVHEYMGESRLCFWIPQQLLKLWINEEKGKINLLQDLGKLIPEWERSRLLTLHESMNAISVYTQGMRNIASNKGPSFKESARKAEKDMEFVPTNLHTQRLSVHNETTEQGGCYDIISHGAFIAYAQKFRNGGLRRLLIQQQELYSSNRSSGNKLCMSRASEIMATMLSLKSESVGLCERLCHAALQANADDLKTTMQSIADKVRQLIQLCDSPTFEQAAVMYAEAKVDTTQDTAQSPRSPTRTRSGKQSPEKTWHWSGSDFVRSPTVEPWELTCLNMDAAIVCTQSKVDDLVKYWSGEGQQSQWLAEISPAVIKLQSFLEVLTRRALLLITFLTLAENRDNIPLMHTIKYRRDVVFSHAVTTLTTGLVTQLRSSITDELFFTQLVKIGILAEFECLLSCYGDEQGMLEDMVVGVADLASVSFKLEKSEKSDDVLPILETNRCGLIVKIPVSGSLFELLPDELKRGHLIRVTPVLFNIGINEQATLAERFGDTSLQDLINVENGKRMNAYYEKYVDIIGNPEGGVDTPSDANSAENLTKRLYYNVMTKKSKNVEILQIAGELCHKLKGLRFASCKSGKDRTSMSVTLEQVRLLQQRHGLASHVFQQALDCFRSEGVRRENVFKNIGARKYAFSSLQLLSMPKLYRPPSGTYGIVQS